MKGKKTLKVVLWALLGVAVIVPVIVFSFRNAIICGQIERYCEGLGIPVDIESFDIGLFQSQVKISGLKVYNPGRGREELFLDVPLIYVDYEARPVLRGKLHCSNVELDIQEIVIVKDEGGSNIERFYEVLSAGEEKEPGMSAEKGKPAGRETQIKETEKKEIDIKIKKLVLSIGHIKIKGTEKRERYITLDIDHEEFNDLTGTKEITSAVTKRILAKASFRGLGEAFGPLLSFGGGLGEDIKGGVKSIKDQLGIFFGTDD